MSIQSQLYAKHANNKKKQWVKELQRAIFPIYGETADLDATRTVALSNIQKVINEIKEFVFGE